MYRLTSGVFIKILALIISCNIFIPSWSQSVIGEWNFNTTLAGTGSAYATVSAASLGSAVTQSGFENNMFWASNSWPTATSVNANAYLQFSITPTAGNTLNISSIDLDMRRGLNNGQGPKSWALRSSRDGYTTDIATGSLGTGNSVATITLGSAFVNLTTGVTFRIYGYNLNGNGSGSFVWNNITLRGMSILPINFSAITGSITDNKATVNWNIGESNILSFFEIERSNDGNNFSIVDKIYKQSTERYSFTDKQSVSGNFVWYRIKSIDTDGTTNYSEILKLQNVLGGQLTIQKIIAAGSLYTIQVNTPLAGNAKIVLSSADGRLLSQQNTSFSKGIQTIQVNRNNVPGIQILTIVQNDQRISRQFVN